MSESQSRSSGGPRYDSDPNEHAGLGVLRALSDPKCRAMLRATAKGALTAGELSEELDLPLSTVYRKLERLVDASLIEETCRITSHGKHPSQYRCAVDRVSIGVYDEDQSQLDIDMAYRPGVETTAANDGGDPDD